jgi:glycosyltransferase involved in cell wall biosynthesis
MHGDYLLYQNKIDAAKVARIFDYYKDVQNVLRNINHIVTISDEQKNHIQALITRLHLTAPISKIYNGYAPGLLTIKENTGINSISKNCFVVGMVARGIKEKGWFELISAFLKASLPDSVLLLVGGGNYIEDLKKHFVEYSQIIFTGATSNPLSYISQMDVACLPSYYEAESLPTSIIEYLYLGKPVIATYKGEIPNMLAIGSEMACGFCIDSSNSDALIEGITESLTQLYNKKDLYNIFSKNAKKRSSIFDLDQCCAEYEKIYAYLN